MRIPEPVHLSGVPVDQRGHRQVWVAPNDLTGDRIEEVTLHRIDEDRPLIKAHVSVFGGVYSCHTCDTYPQFEAVANPAGPQGIGLRAATDCTDPHGADTITTLRVSSGRIVVADSLGSHFDFELGDGPDYNSLAGQAEAVRQMSEQGIAYGPVGNTCPSLVCTGPGEYVIASFDDEAEPGEPGYLAGEVLASICTDLWAYSIADRDRWVAHEDSDPSVLVEAGQHPHAMGSSSEPVVLDFPNGVYEFTLHTTRADFESRHPGPVIYAHVIKTH